MSVPIPRSRPKASQDIVVQALIDSGLWSNDKITRFSVIGVRGYYDSSMGKPNQNDRGMYDDAAFILSPTCFKSFNFNTDPHSFRIGRAMMEAPQRLRYVAGWHGYGRSTGHPAFRQASDVIVKRDGKTGHGTPLGNGRFKDRASKRFWINLHRGGNTTTASAGCQTIPPVQWKEFHYLVHAQMKKWKQPNFNYFLIEGPIT